MKTILVNKGGGGGGGTNYVYLHIYLSQVDNWPHLKTFSLHITSINHNRMADLRVKNYKSIIVMMQINLTFSTQTFLSLNVYVILINQSDELIVQFCSGMKSICK